MPHPDSTLKPSQKPEEPSDKAIIDTEAEISDKDVMPTSSTFNNASDESLEIWREEILRLAVKDIEYTTMFKDAFSLSGPANLRAEKVHPVWQKAIKKFRDSHPDVPPNVNFPLDDRAMLQV
jgi:hypothetical protein